MKKLIIVIFSLLLFVSTKAQSDVYSVTSGEVIFGWADVNREINNTVESINNNIRFTIFFHLGQYVHYDFSNTVGIYSGAAIRNVGFITKDTDLDLEKEVHRTYTLGVPLALKLGSFKDHFYLFGGAECELAFHYKYKWWEGGTKYKTTEWFSNRTNRFLPSVFGGIQFPKGLNLKVKYYLTDLLNNSYNKGSNPRNDYTDYRSSQMFHLSLCWQFNTKDIKKAFSEDFFETATR